MKTTLLASLVAVVLVIAASFTAARAQEADRALDGFFRNYLDQYFRLRPLDATKLGDHRFDNQLDDVSRLAREGWTAHLRQTLGELPRRVDFAKLSRAGQIDFEIFQHELTKSIWQAENTRPFEEDPRVYNEYLSDSVFLLLAQSTLSNETNIANCLARM